MRREVRVNLAYPWFCGLSIEDKIPDHSAFSRARNERFRDSDIFRLVFERVVKACIAAGLFDGSGVAVDASPYMSRAPLKRLSSTFWTAWIRIGFWSRADSRELLRDDRVGRRGGWGRRFCW